MAKVFDSLCGGLSVRAHGGGPFEECCPEHGIPGGSGFESLKTWCAFLVSVLFHGALLSAPFSINTTRQPVCDEIQLFIARGGGAPAPTLGAPEPPEEQVEETQVTAPPPRESVVVEKVIPKPPPAKPVKKKPVVKPAPRTIPPRPAEPPVESETPAQSPGEGSSPGHALASHAPGPPGQGTAAQGPVESSFGASDGPGFLRRVLPTYPHLAREMGKEGTVLLRLTIDERGRLIEAGVAKGAGFGFDEQALRAARESTFRPARRDGRPIMCRAILPIQFILEGPDHD